MPQRRHRRSLDLGWLFKPRVVLLFVAAAMVGLLSGLSPAIALAAVVGSVLALVLVSNVTLGLLVFTAIAFLETLPTVAGGPSLAKLFGLCLLIGWLMTIALRPEEGAGHDVLARNPVLSWAIALFLAWVFFSQLWAEDVAVTQETFLRFALGFVLFPIVMVAIRAPRHVVWLYTVFVVGALATAAIGANGAESGEARLSGVGLNPNEFGALLVVASVLAATLAFDRSLSGLARFGSFIAACLAVLALFMTESRGATLGLVAALLAAPILAGPRRRLAALGFVAVAGLTMVVWVSAFAPAEIGERLTQTDTSAGSGRADLWTIAWRIFEDKPVHGVGGGNFQVSSIHYLLEPGAILRDEYIVDTPKVPHNVYLQVLSELGLVGLVLFATIILICLGCIVRAARAFRQSGDNATELLARGLLVALTGLLVAGFFSSDIFSKQLYLLLAVGPALLAMAEPTRARRQLRQG